MAQPSKQQIAEAVLAADSILSLLHYRGLVDSRVNQVAVEKASIKLAALRRWYEPILVNRNR